MRNLISLLLIQAIICYLSYKYISTAIRILFLYDFYKYFLSIFSDYINICQLKFFLIINFIVFYRLQNPDSWFLFQKFIYNFVLDEIIL